MWHIGESVTEITISQDVQLVCWCIFSKTNATFILLFSMNSLCRRLGVLDVNGNSIEQTC